MTDLFFMTSIVRIFICFSCTARSFGAIYIYKLISQWYASWLLLLKSKSMNMFSREKPIVQWLCKSLKEKIS